MKWPLARVIQLHKGSDGIARVITLCIAASTFKRPIAKICVLPADTEVNNSPTLLSKARGNVGEKNATTMEKSATDDASFPDGSILH